MIQARSNCDQPPKKSNLEGQAEKPQEMARNPICLLHPKLLASPLCSGYQGMVNARYGACLWGFLFTDNLNAPALSL